MTVISTNYFFYDILMKFCIQVNTFEEGGKKTRFVFVKLLMRDVEINNCLPTI